jgi:hypothetical protein
MYPRDLVNSPWLMLLIVDLVHAPVKEDHGGTANSTLRAHHRALSRSHSTVACAPIDGRVRRQGCSQWRHLFLPRARPPCSSSTGAFKTRVCAEDKGKRVRKKVVGLGFRSEWPERFCSPGIIAEPSYHDKWLITSNPVGTALMSVTFSRPKPTRRPGA